MLRNPFAVSTATTTGSKLAALWMPVTAFVTLGLEHSVANMFTLPLGIMSGADFGGGCLLAVIISSVLSANSAVNVPSPAAATIGQRLHICLILSPYISLVKVCSLYPSLTIRLTRCDAPNLLTLAHAHVMQPWT